MKALNQTPRFIRGSALMLAACAAAALLCVNTASAQSCPYTVAPGETLDLAQASTGNATSPSSPHGAGLGLQAGSYDPSENRVEAFAGVPVGILGARASAYGQINFLFCVRGNPSVRGTPPNVHVNATISANVNWVGVLYGASSGAGVPSVTGTLSLVDMGTDGSQSNVIASSQPLTASLANNPIQVSVGPFNVNFGYSFITGSAPAPMTGRVTVGHVYAIQYNLDCEAPSGVVGDAVCSFAQSTNFKPIGLPIGNYNSTVDSLQVTLDQDLYGMLVAIKSEVDGLQAQVAANRQAIAAASLTAEQENAQLLGILNEIKSLLSALQAAPSASRALKTDPPNRPTSPRPPPRILPEQR